MIRKLTTLAAAGALSFGLSSAANADFISGTIGFSGSLPFSGLGDVVSDITLFTPQAPTVASVGTGDFAGTTPAVAMTNPIDINAPGGNIFMVGGFTFELLSVAGVQTDPLECLAGLCTDDIRFTMTGEVSAAGFDDTLWSGNFTANGTCLQEGDACADGSKSATWSATIVALEEPVVDMPIPGTLLLVGLGLLGAHTARRRAA